MRYSKYKPIDAKWASSLPSHWDYVPLRHIFIERKEVNSTASCMNILSLTNTHGVIPYSQKGNMGNKQKDDLSSYRIAHVNDLVVNSMNVIIGSSGVSKYYGCVSPVYYTLAIRNDDNVNYYGYLFKIPPFFQSLKPLGNGILEIRLRIPMNKLNSVMLPVPPREEQDQIVRYLDWKVSCINKLIHGYQRQLELIDEEWQTIENHICLNGLHKMPLKDSGNKWIGNIPCEWKTIKLGQFCSFQNGISESGDFFTEGNPFVNYSDVYRHLELPENVSGRAKSNEKQQAIYSVERGDIFFTRTSENIEEAGMAAVCLHSIPNAVFSGFLIRCRPTKNIVDTNFIKHYLQIPAVRNHFSSTMNIVTRASVGQYLLRQLTVVVPPMEEQHEIADYLGEESLKYELIKENIRHEIELLKEYRTRLISDVVTGQMDVRGVAVPEYVPEADEEGAELDETLSNADEETEV